MCSGFRMAVKLSQGRGTIPARKWMTRGFAGLAIVFVVIMLIV